ncbi:MAG: 3-methyl-2-oxobutanoate dehydrogenase subunit beta, partial [Desulfobulbaceae bacterium]
QRPRWTEQEIRELSPWATVGRTKDRQNNIITSLNLKSDVQEEHNRQLQAKYKTIIENEVRYEESYCDDADVILVAYGTSARICQKAVDIAREQGIKLGLLRPISLFPFPEAAFNKYAEKVKGFLSVEMSAGQMVEDIRLVVEGRTKVAHYGRMGGIVPTTEEIIENVKNLIN